MITELVRCKGGSLGTHDHPNRAGACRHAAIKLINHIVASQQNRTAAISGRAKHKPYVIPDNVTDPKKLGAHLMKKIFTVRTKTTDHAVKDSSGDGSGDGRTRTKTVTAIETIYPYILEAVRNVPEAADAFAAVLNASGVKVPDDLVGPSRGPRHDAGNDVPVSGACVCWGGVGLDVTERRALWWRWERVYVQSFNACDKFRQLPCLIPLISLCRIQQVSAL